MKALGFLLQFGEIDVHSFKGLIGKLFIRFAVKAFRIQATLVKRERESVVMRRQLISSVR